MMSYFYEMDKKKLQTNESLGLLFDAQGNDSS